MKNSIVKIISILLATVLILTISACSNNTAEETDEKTESNDSTETEPNEEDPLKSIDIYLISGQSNAAGFTKFDSFLLDNFWEEHSTGTEYVIYSGVPEYVKLSEEINWQPVRSGLGAIEDRMGPEVGMAKVLYDEYYNEDSGKVAGFIKFAHGGTSLYSFNDYSIDYGNWLSSYKDADDSELNGKLYRGLLLHFERSINALKEQGYEKINVKGIFWMQGETDRSDPSLYIEPFKAFVSDLRTDLGEIMGEDLSEMPIIIGEISRSFLNAYPENIAMNEKFIEMQRGLAKDIENAYIIESSPYDINVLDEKTGTNVTFTDSAHWDTNSMFKIGELVGRCIIDNILN